MYFQKKEKKIGKENTGEKNKGKKKGTHKVDKKAKGNEGQENEKKQCSPV